MKFFKRCENLLNPCSSNPCANNGYCSPVIGAYSFTCLCQQGYTGLLCAAQISPCSSNPCVNSGTCILNGNSNWVCVCSPGYTGKQISKIDFRQFNFHFKFIGLTCSYQIQVCYSNPCLNGGTCTQSQVNRYACQCPPGISGIK